MARPDQAAADIPAECPFAAGPAGSSKQRLPAAHGAGPARACLQVLPTLMLTKITAVMVVVVVMMVKTLLMTVSKSSVGSWRHLLVQLHEQKMPCHLVEQEMCRSVLLE